MARSTEIALDEESLKNLLTTDFEKDEIGRSKFAIYEMEKARIDGKDLTPQEYQTEIKELAARLEI